MVSDIEENTQVTDEYATTFKTGNVEDLQKKLQECLNEKDRRKTEEIQKYVLKKYNWDDIVKEIERVYSKK